MLCYEYPPIGGGGAKVVQGLCDELTWQGHNVDLVTMSYKNLPLHEKINNYNIYRIKCLRLKSNICTPLEMITYIFSALPLLIKLCLKNKYEINHTHFIFPDGILAYIIKKLTSLNYVITAHGSDVPGYNPDRFRILHKFLKPFWRIITRNSKTLIVPSKNLDSLVRKTDEKINTAIIPNGINLNKFSASEKRESKILLVTRMFERKGVQYFIKAISDFNNGYSVNIVGEGPYLETLKQISAKINTRVNFLGYLDNSSNELRKLYESSKIFVFTSEAENFPVVLLEAMISGLAIITTNDTGCAEVVGDTAILVKSRDSSAIKDALSKLIDDPVLCSKLGKAARQRVEKFFGWNTIGSSHITLYSQLLNNKPSVFREVISA